MGPKEARSTILSPQEGAIVVAFQRHTLLPSDYCLYALQPTIPYLTRSSLHRGLKLHDIKRLLDVDGDMPECTHFRAYLNDYFHIGIDRVSVKEGKLHLFVMAYNYDRHFETLRGLTLYVTICQA